MIVFKSDHLCRHLSAGLAAVDAADIADGGPAPGGLDGHAHDVFDLPRAADGLRVVHMGDQLPKHVLHLPAPVTASLSEYL